MAARIQDMTGVLLAGGKSRRMGQDKRFLELGGLPLLQRALAVLESLFSDILVVAAEPLLRLQGLPHRVVTDLIPNCAALGGLYTGLSLADRPRIFAFGCDMPFLNQAVIARMAGLDTQADVVMATLSTGLQPLHAIYSKACLPHLERMAQAQQLTVQELTRTPGLSVRLVQERDLRDIDPQFLSFLNINTPADLEFARKLLAESDPHAGPQR